VEDVSAVHDGVDLPVQRGRKRAVVVGQEIVPAPAAPDARRRDGKVEPQVGVGEEEDPNGHPANVRDSGFLR
jgi:hypothetical protein